MASSAAGFQTRSCRPDSSDSSDSPVTSLAADQRHYRCGPAVIRDGRTRDACHPCGTSCGARDATLNVLPSKGGGTGDGKRSSRLPFKCAKEHAEFRQMHQVWQSTWQLFLLRGGAEMLTERTFNLCSCSIQGDRKRMIQIKIRYVQAHLIFFQVSTCIPRKWVLGHFIYMQYLATRSADT